MTTEKLYSPYSLRARAEEWLRLSRKDITDMPPQKVQELMDELQLHQLELQIQNEELRQAHAELEASCDKYWDLYDFAPVGYLTLDGKSTIAETNMMASKQLGVARKELVGMQLVQFIAPAHQDIFRLHSFHVLGCTEVHSCELELAPRGGGVLYARLDSLATPATPGHYRMAITDISAQKNLEKALVMARDEALSASRAKTQFLANMSHEIRTPLNAIIGLGKILQTTKPLTARQQEQLDVLNLSAGSLLSLINELLDIAKIETCGLQLEHISFDLSGMVSEVITILAVKAHEKGLTLTAEKHLTHAFYWGDPLRLRQVLLNLVSNAIKFTDKGAVTVHIETIFEKDGWANISISVKDTGIGIEKTKQSCIFDAFTQADPSMTRRYGGSGLGLAIAKQLVEQMKGSIDVTSTEGDGSIFTIQLPLEISDDNKTSHEHPIALPAIKINSGDKTRILLVEDHLANVLITTTFLESYAYAYDVASNGRQAVRLAQKNHYALILMDVQMQDMDGFEATRLIRQIEKNNKLPCTPIIAMTAHALSGDKEKCLQAGMTDYISKPFNPDEFREKIMQHIVK